MAEITHLTRANHAACICVVWGWRGSPITVHIIMPPPFPFFCVSRLRNWDYLPSLKPGVCVSGGVYTYHSAHICLFHLYFCIQRLRIICLASALVYVCVIYVCGMVFMCVCMHVVCMVCIVCVCICIQIQYLPHAYYVPYI